MPECTVIIVRDVVNSEFCTASEDGERVHGAIVDALRQGKDVCLSFKKVKDLTSAFLNTAVGRLYDEYSEEEIREHLLPPTDVSPDDLMLLKRVVDRAKEFFKEPDRFTNATNQILGTDDDGPQQAEE